MTANVPQQLFTIDELLGNVDRPDEEEILEKPPTKALQVRSQHLIHRLFSERTLEEILPSELHAGECHHIISGGDIDSLSFLMWILRKQKISRLLCSTWCVSLVDIQELERHHTIGNIGKLDFYVGEILPGSYPAEYKAIGDLCRKTGGRVAVFRNHSKVMAGVGEKFSFTIESSANINTNPRTENTVVTIDENLCKFYFSFFDEIKSFDKEWR